MTGTKADKLISRGSENPQVALAAREISEMLTRMSLGQSQYFAECVERVFPELTQPESEALAAFFERTADYFKQKAEGEKFPHTGYGDRAVRTWKTSEDYFYAIHKVFCVLACQLEHCPENMGCWETRSAFCRMDENETQSKLNSSKNDKYNW